MKKPLKRPSNRLRTKRRNISIQISERSWAVYAARAVKDPTNREKWVQQAALYIDKSVTLAPADPINMVEAASGTERLGDISGQGCPYYEKAREYTQTGMSQLKSDCIFVSDERVPRNRSETSSASSWESWKLTEAKCGQNP